MLPAVEAHSLGKRYQLGKQSALDLLAELSVGLKSTAGEGFWALYDASFQISPGEAVGFLGKNGAGKSTLLKVLSRVTKPSAGHAVLRGRLGCLLEVGTGFHPDLSGRDNIFLSGSILGMPYRRVAERFEEIVEFSELGDFIDMPVKRYSSGMYVKLAFSVASFLEPDILIVDEVLAVGDAAFQRKSLGSLNRSAHTKGTAVLFVSHNLDAVRMFCTRVIVLDGGRLLFDGPTADGINYYLQLISDETRSRVGHGDGGILLIGARCRQSNGEESWSTHPGDSVVLEFDYQVAGSVDAGFVRLPIVSATDGTAIATIEEPLASRNFVFGAKGTVKIELRNIPLRQGEFKVEPEILDSARRVASRIKPSIQLPFLRVEPRSKDRYERIGLVELPSKISSSLYPSGQG